MEAVMLLAIAISFGLAGISFVLAPIFLVMNLKNVEFL